MNNIIWYFRILYRQWSWYNDSVTLFIYFCVAIFVGLISILSSFPFWYITFIYFCVFTIFHQFVKFIGFSIYIIFLMYTKKDFEKARRSIEEMYNWRQSDKNKRGIFVEISGEIKLCKM